jgi:hypothetical protein
MQNTGQGPRMGQHSIRDLGILDGDKPLEGIRHEWPVYQCGNRNGYRLSTLGIDVETVTRALDPWEISQPSTMIFIKFFKHPRRNSRFK